MFTEVNTLVYSVKIRLRNTHYLRKKCGNELVCDFAHIAEW